jgi:rhamnosyltransferase
MKTVFFSILYNPEINAVNNISNAIENGFEVYVYNNKIDAKILDLISNLKNVNLIGNGINVGLGQAFFEFENLFINSNFESFIYFDQDTIVQSSAWFNIKLSINKNSKNKNQSLLFFTSNNRIKSNPVMIINSGSYFTKELIKLNGLHNNLIFLECIDYEYCLRLRENNLKIQTVYIQGIDHNSLQEKNEIKLFSRSISFRYYGNKRIKEFNKEILKLIIRSIVIIDYKSLFFFVKSIINFNISNFLAIILIKL